MSDRKSRSKLYASPWQRDARQQSNLHAYRGFVPVTHRPQLSPTTPAQGTLDAYFARKRETERQKSQVHFLGGGEHNQPDVLSRSI